MNSLLISDESFEVIQAIHEEIEGLKKHNANLVGALIRYINGKEGWGEAEVELLESLG